jgi:hypothetical protein
VSEGGPGDSWRGARGGRVGGTEGDRETDKQARRRPEKLPANVWDPREALQCGSDRTAELLIDSTEIENYFCDGGSGSGTHRAR